MGLSDLVQAKKAQCDKDWPMLRRLIEAHYFQNREKATTAEVRFWLRELRTPELLVETALRWPAAWRAQKRHRRLLADARYWAPLKTELLVITDRGKPIGELGPAAGGRSAEQARALVRKGVASWSGGKPKGLSGAPRPKAGLVSVAVIEDRR
jgi:hypothetical protein